MKSSLTNYKDYPFPFRFLLSYVFITAIGIALLDAFSLLLINNGASDNFFETILSVALTLIVFVIGGFILGGIVFSIFCAGKKVYRGIGLYHILNTLSILGGIAFIGLIIFMEQTNVSYTFFNLFTLFLECCIPVLMNFFLRTYLQRCDRCGLIKTMGNYQTKTESLGTRVKYHNEGGYYKDVQTTGKITGTTVSSDNFDVRLTSRQYVPKTTVRDGEFEKRRSISKSVCGVCGNVMTSSYEYEKKIND